MTLTRSLCYPVFDVVKNDQQEDRPVSEQTKYQITIQGWIGPHWADWFGGLAMTYEGKRDDSTLTVLSGPVADQAALRGILCKLWDLNLTLLSVIRVEQEKQTQEEIP
jgi:hypothetical protein